MFEEIIKKGTQREVIIPVGNKKHSLFIYDTTEKDEVFIKCEGANISQPYGLLDIPTLLSDLPEMIRQEQSQNKNSIFQFRITPKEKIKLEKNAQKEGYNNVSQYIKDKCLV